jgi:hypothetical protein
VNGRLRSDLLTRGELDQLDQALAHDPTAPQDLSGEWAVAPLRQRVATQDDDRPRAPRRRRRRMQGR